VNITDQKGLTALDTVKDMPSQKSRQIAALILGKHHMYKKAQRTVKGSELLISLLAAVIQCPVCLLQVT